MSKASGRCTFMVYSRDTEVNVLMSCSLKVTQYMDQTKSQLYSIWMSVPKVNMFSTEPAAEHLQTAASVPSSYHCYYC